MEIRITKLVVYSEPGDESPLVISDEKDIRRVVEDIRRGVFEAALLVPDEDEEGFALQCYISLGEEEEWCDVFEDY
jgi:hypothetical protein